jgi:hypothetical protein
VWQTDITYLRTSSGFVYLTALIDVYSRLVIEYRLSSSLCVDSCLLALEDAISKYGKPEIINCQIKSLLLHFISGILCLISRVIFEAGSIGTITIGLIKLLITRRHMRYIVDLWISLTPYPQFHNINNYKNLFFVVKFWVG